MYASDNREVLPNNLGGQGVLGGWSQGWLTETPGNPDNTNYVLMMGGAIGGTPAQATTIGAYTKNPSIYQCPADPILAPGYGMPRVRSYSMDFTIGSKSTDAETPSAYANYWPDFFKTTDFRMASATMVFLDEHPDSINDGLFLVTDDDGDTTTWGDFPASYHNGSCNFSFADGHEESHKWRDPRTDHAVMNTREWLPYPEAPPYVDLLWVESRCSPQPYSENPGQCPGP